LFLRQLAMQIVQLSSARWLVERFASVEALQDADKVVKTIKGMVGFYRKTA